jgi:hypothetical protein
VSEATGVEEISPDGAVDGKTDNQGLAASDAPADGTATDGLTSSDGHAGVGKASEGTGLGTEEPPATLAAALYDGDTITDGVGDIEELIMGSGLGAVEVIT